jgi:hypothetical protein
MPPLKRYRNYGARLPAVARASASCIALILLAAGCGPDAETQRIQATTKATYDPQTGLLTQFTYDKNKNGRVDTWVRMDGARLISAVLDENEDGAIDRWEEYGDAGQLVRAGWIRAALDAQAAATALKAAPVQAPTVTPMGIGTPPPITQPPNAWAYIGPGGAVARVEYFDVSEAGASVLTLREFFENGQLARTEEDTDADGAMDTWQTHASGALVSAEFDENRDGKPDRRFTYNASGQMVLIESEPDASGRYTRRVVPGGTVVR